MGRDARVLAIDAGGAMTDPFLIDQHGEFAVGKAPTIPEDESVGFVNSINDALSIWDITPDKPYETMKAGTYSGTVY